MDDVLITPYSTLGTAAVAIVCDDGFSSCGYSNRTLTILQVCTET